MEAEEDSQLVSELQLASILHFVVYHRKRFRFPRIRLPDLLRALTDPHEAQFLLADILARVLRVLRNGDPTVRMANAERELAVFLSEKRPSLAKLMARGRLEDLEPSVKSSLLLGIIEFIYDDLIPSWEMQIKNEPEPDNVEDVGAIECGQDTKLRKYYYLDDHRLYRQRLSDTDGHPLAQCYELVVGPSPMAWQNFVRTLPPQEDDLANFVREFLLETVEYELSQKQHLAPLVELSVDALHYQERVSLRQLRIERGEPVPAEEEPGPGPSTPGSGPHSNSPLTPGTTGGPPSNASLSAKPNTPGTPGMAGGTTTASNSLIGGPPSVGSTPAELQRILNVGASSVAPSTAPCVTQGAKPPCPQVMSLNSSGGPAGAVTESPSSLGGAALQNVGPVGSPAMSVVEDQANAAMMAAHPHANMISQRSNFLPQQMNPNMAVYNGPPPPGNIPMMPRGGLPHVLPGNQVHVFTTAMANDCALSGIPMLDYHLMHPHVRSFIEMSDRVPQASVRGASSAWAEPNLTQEQLQQRQAKMAQLRDIGSRFGVMSAPGPPASQPPGPIPVGGLPQPLNEEQAKAQVRWGELVRSHYHGKQPIGIPQGGHGPRHLLYGAPPHHHLAQAQQPVSRMPNYQPQPMDAPPANMLPPAQEMYQNAGQKRMYSSVWNGAAPGAAMQPGGPPGPMSGVQRAGQPQPYDPMHQMAAMNSANNGIGPLAPPPPSTSGNGNKRRKTNTAANNNNSSNSSSNNNNNSSVQNSTSVSASAPPNSSVMANTLDPLAELAAVGSMSSPQATAQLSSVHEGQELTIMRQLNNFAADAAMQHNPASTASSTVHIPNKVTQGCSAGLERRLSSNEQSPHARSTGASSGATQRLTHIDMPPSATAMSHHPHQSSNMSINHSAGQMNPMSVVATAHGHHPSLNSNNSSSMGCNTGGSTSLTTSNLTSTSLERLAHLSSQMPVGGGPFQSIQMSGSSGNSSSGELRSSHSSVQNQLSHTSEHHHTTGSAPTSTASPLPRHVPHQAPLHQSVPPPGPNGNIVNNTYVTAYFDVQQMNYQQVASGGSGAMQAQQQGKFHSAQTTGGLQPQQPPPQTHPPGGTGSVQVQVAHKTPNTIQYMPATPPEPAAPRHTLLPPKMPDFGELGTCGPLGMGPNGKPGGPPHYPHYQMATVGGLAGPPHGGDPSASSGIMHPRGVVYQRGVGAQHEHLQGPPSNGTNNDHSIYQPGVMLAQSQVMMQQGPPGAGGGSHHSLMQMQQMHYHQGQFHVPPGGTGGHEWASHSHDPSGGHYDPTQGSGGYHVSSHGPLHGPPHSQHPQHLHPHQMQHPSLQMQHNPYYVQRSSISAGAAPQMMVRHDMMPPQSRGAPAAPQGYQHMGI